MNKIADLLVEFTAACVEYGRMAQRHEYNGVEAQGLQNQRDYVEKLLADLQDAIPLNEDKDVPNAA